MMRGRDHQPAYAYFREPERRKDTAREIECIDPTAPRWATQPFRRHRPPGPSPHTDSQSHRRGLGAGICKYIQPLPESVKVLFFLTLLCHHSSEDRRGRCPATGCQSVAECHRTVNPALLASSQAGAQQHRGRSFAGKPPKRSIEVARPGAQPPNLLPLPLKCV